MNYSVEIAASFDMLEQWLRTDKLDAALEEIDHLQKLVDAELGALQWENRAMQQVRRTR